MFVFISFFYKSSTAVETFDNIPENTQVMKSRITLNENLIQNGIAHTLNSEAVFQIFTSKHLHVGWGGLFIVIGLPEQALS